MTLDFETSSGLNLAMSYRTAAALLAVGGLATVATYAVVTHNDLRATFLSSALESEDVDYAIAVAAGAAESMDGIRLLSKNYGAGFIDRVNDHIEKLFKAYPSAGPPDPNDPRDYFKKKWVKDLKKLVGEIKKALNRMPKNKLKRAPYEETIKKAEDVIRQYSAPE